MANYGYDKDTDYSELIKQDIARGDYRSAGIHEQMRNEKIRGEGITGYETTSHFSSYLPRTDDINSGMDKLANREAWSYDANADPAMQAYRKQFLREADRQTRDTLGNYAGMTGGMPSTAAVSAAQQAGNYERSKLADKIPELMQADFNRYMQGREADRADLLALAGLDRQNAQDSLGLQQWDWQKQQQEIANAMQRWSQTGLADEYVAQILGVPVGTSTQDLAYQQWQQQMSQAQFDWQKEQAQQSSAYDRVMAMIQLGIVPDAASLAAAGLSQSQAAQMAAIYKEMRTSAGSTGGGTSAGDGHQPKPGQDSPQPKPDHDGSGSDNAKGSRYAELSDLVRRFTQHMQTAASYNSMVQKIVDAYQSGGLTKEAANELLAAMGYSG